MNTKRDFERSYRILYSSQSEENETSLEGKFNLEIFPKVPKVLRTEVRKAIATLKKENKTLDAISNEIMELCEGEPSLFLHLYSIKYLSPRLFRHNG